MKITFLGHSAFIIESDVTVIVDPFLTENPKAAMHPDEITKADIVLVTHSHPDHIGDAISIAKRTGAVLVGVHEVAMSYELAGEGMNIGGTIKVKDIPITMVKADHSTNLGDSAGFVWKQEGKNLYHMGDTGLFSDIKLISELYMPEIVFIPIGDRYTMDPELAAMAVRWMNPKLVFPMHYGTFPFLVQSAAGFEKKAKEGSNATVITLNPGGSVDV